ncbi:MAG TPA: tryptophanase [Candidatus Obscuribacterales bacterium]
MRTVIEPFRVKTVEPIKFTTASERQAILSRAGYNLFSVNAEDVIVDLLTDSGTSALSHEQWAAMMHADESYAGCKSFFRLRETVEKIFGFPEVIPVHQGRAAERLLFGQLVMSGDVIVSNTHFDTTRANIEALGATALDLPSREFLQSASMYPFKGDIDLESVADFLSRKDRPRMPFAMITITNNAAGGQPASLENLREYVRLLRAHDIPLFIDAARFAENAYLIKLRSPEYANQSIEQIVKSIFELAEGCLMSAKKDGLSNIGGFLALRDKQLASRLKEQLILTEGFPTYGGLAGRDLESIHVGLNEVLDESYLRYRAVSAEYLARGLLSHGIPISTPPGMHAIYVDAGRFLPHIPWHEFPGQVLVCELYLEAGVRACEIGSVMFGKTDPSTGKALPAKSELVRLALPRRAYSQSHYDYVIEALANVFDRKASLAGLKMVEAPCRLRHFTARFEPVATRANLSASC